MQCDTASLTLIASLESLLPDDSIDHGVCPICYPKGSDKQLAVCGTDVTDEPLMPIAECVNICEACKKLEPTHMLKHKINGDY